MQNFKNMAFSILVGRMTQRAVSPANISILSLYFYHPKDLNQHTSLLNKTLWFAFGDVIWHLMWQDSRVLVWWHVIRWQELSTWQPPISCFCYFDVLSWFEWVPKDFKALTAYLKPLQQCSLWCPTNLPGIVAPMAIPVQTLRRV